LNELLEEGVGNRIQRYKKAATTIRERMAKLGVKPVLPRELWSNSLTSYHLPAGLPYQTLHDRLKEQGYVIYAGQGGLEHKIFRIANMGALTVQQIEGFLQTFERVLEQAEVRA
jgi:2-aminoethylphosphonate-pyruvate transaminase